MHDVFIIGVPLVVILAGILLNRSEFKDLRSEIKDVRSEMRSEFKEVRSEMKDLRGDVGIQIQGIKADAAARHSEVLARFNVLEADMRQFYHLTGKLEARVDTIEKR
jgi:hypothetical protein